jgi:uncharacterized protein (TIGR03437 family)
LQFPSKRAGLFLPLLLLGGPACGQTMLSLSSGSAIPGGSVSLTLVLTIVSGAAPAGLQWTLSYAAGDVVSVSTVAGAAITGAGKTLYCNPKSGSVTCIATGMNTTAMSSGVVAVVTLGLAAGLTSSTEPLPLTGLGGVLFDGSMTTVTGSGGTISVTQPVLPTVTTLQCSPTNVVSGSASVCTATISQAAPAGGATVALASNNALLTVPSSVTVGAGGTTASFSATAGSIPADQAATVTATLNGQSRTANLSLVAPVLVSSLACSPTSLNSGAATTCTVTLTKAAPTGGASVALSSNNALLPVAASVNVAAGATTASFNATVGSINSDQSATLTATLNGQSRTATVNLLGKVLVSSLACNPTSLKSGAASSCTVTLSKAAASGGTGVGVSANNGAVTVPPTVTVAAGVSSATFNATAGSVSANQPVTVTASLNGSSAAAALTVAPVLPTISKLQCSPTTLASYGSAACTVTLAAPATSGGAKVTLTDNSGQLYTPASVTVSAGSSSATFSVIAGSIRSGRSSQTATVTVSLNGSSASFVLTLQGRNGTQSNISSIDGKMDGPNTHSQPQDAASGLYCSPRTSAAGSRLTCELRLPADPTVRQLEIASSSDQVRVPAVAAARSNQSRLTFQAHVEPGAKRQLATVTATLGESRFDDTILVMPAPGPILGAPGRQVAKSGERVRFEVSAAEPSGLAVELTARDLPNGAGFDAASGLFDWVPRASDAGRYEMTFTATNAAGQSSTALVPLEVGPGGPVLNSSERFSCSPRSVASLAGEWLADSASASSEPSGQALELGGTRVRVNGQYVPVLSSSADHVRFLCPGLDPGTPISLAVETGVGSTTALTAVMREASPAILTLDGSRQGWVSFPGSEDLAMARNYLVRSHPAQPDDQVLIWATGLGSAAAASAGAVTVRAGGLYAEVEAVRAVPGYAGIYVVQIRVPGAIVLGDELPLELGVTTVSGEQAWSNVVTMAVEGADR